MAPTSWQVMEVSRVVGVMVEGSGFNRSSVNGTEGWRQSVARLKHKGKTEHLLSPQLLVVEKGVGGYDASGGKEAPVIRGPCRRYRISSHPKNQRRNFFSIYSVSPLCIRAPPDDLGCALLLYWSDHASGWRDLGK